MYMNDSRLKNRARSIALSMLQLIQEDENETSNFGYEGTNLEEVKNA